MVKEGRKTFEVRVDDRCFMVGDVLLLECWDPATESYRSGPQWQLARLVTYILPGAQFGIEAGYVVMAIN